MPIINAEITAASLLPNFFHFKSGLGLDLIIVEAYSRFPNYLHIYLQNRNTAIETVCHDKEFDKFRKALDELGSL